MNLYKKWDESPVIVTFSEKMVPIKNIPFPAITICPEVKSRKEIFNFTEVVLKIDTKASIIIPMHRKVTA